MKSKNLGNLTLEPVEAPNKSGELHTSTFGRTVHAGVNFLDAAGRFQKGWVPLDLWNILPDAP